MINKILVSYKNIMARSRSLSCSSAELDNLLNLDKNIK